VLIAHGVLHAIQQYLKLEQSIGGLTSGIKPLYITMRGADWVKDKTYTQKPDARRFEYDELSHALLLGASKSVTYTLSIGLQEIATRNAALCSLIREKLGNTPGIRLLDKGNE